MTTKELKNDFNRGLRDRPTDIKIFGEQFVNYYKFKSADGVRYNVCTTEEIFAYFQNR